MRIDRRVAPQEERGRVESALIELARRACPLPITVETFKQIPAFDQPPDHPWIRQLAEWAAREPTAVPYGTNAWAYADLAKACVVIGPGSIDQAHGDEEWVEVSELEKLAGIYARWWAPAADRP
jgi:acetylornithine deacetylase